MTVIAMNSQFMLTVEWLRGLADAISRMRQCHHLMGALGSAGRESRSPTETRSEAVIRVAT